MKPLDDFLGKMMESARLTQAKNPAAATKVIQAALRAAGLLPTPSSDEGGGAGPDLFDLNPVPDWVQTVRSDAKTIAKGSPRASWTAPGRKRSRVAVPDPRAPGEFVQGSFTGTAGTRRFKLYVPSLQVAGPRPLIVMLHGCTQDADDFAAGTEMNALAEQHGFLVLYPEQSHGANATGCWNWFEASHQQRDSGEPSLIAGMTWEIIDRWQADSARIYVAGLSAGGAMAAIMGAAYPDLYTAVGVHSGLPVGRARDMITGLAAMKKVGPDTGSKAGQLRQRVPVIVFHGDQDDVVHSANGEAVLEQFLRPVPDSAGESLRRVQEPGTTSGGRRYTRTAMFDRTGRSVAEHWQLYGAGHAWSGGSRAGSHTDPAGPNASAEMLRFFLGQVD